MIEPHLIPFAHRSRLYLVKATGKAFQCQLNHCDDNRLLNNYQKLQSELLIEKQCHSDTESLEMLKVLMDGSC